MTDGKRRAVPKRWPGTRPDESWVRWRWRILHHHLGECDPHDLEHQHLASMAAFEQAVWRSHTERRCIECGAPGVARHESLLVRVVDHYWMCARCANWWACRAQRDREPVLLAQEYAGYPAEIEVAS